MTALLSAFALTQNPCRDLVSAQQRLIEAQHRYIESLHRVAAAASRRRDPSGGAAARKADVGGKLYALVNEIWSARALTPERCTCSPNTAPCWMCRAKELM